MRESGTKRSSASMAPMMAATTSAPTLIQFAALRASSVNWACDRATHDGDVGEPGGHGVNVLGSASVACQIAVVAAASVKTPRRTHKPYDTTVPAVRFLRASAV